MLAESDYEKEGSISAAVSWVLGALLYSMVARLEEPPLQSIEKEEELAMSLVYRPELRKIIFKLISSKPHESTRIASILNQDFIRFYIDKCKNPLIIPN